MRQPLPGAKSQVDIRLAAIRSELFAGRTDLVRRYVKDLVQFQLDHSEREHLAKSLCSLASTSVDANQIDIADELSDYAMQLDIEDAVIFTTRAEIYKDMGRFEASLSAYREAKLRFPQSQYAWNGVADVLKESGRFEESLEAYREAQRLFPNSSVPRNGYVATLRAQGRRTDALQEALDLVKQFPDDVVSISTLAGALAANGKYDFAIRQYEKIATTVSGDIRAIAGYVRALNASGRQEEALRKLRRFCSAAPGNFGLSNLLAGQLRTVGLLEESISVSTQLLDAAPGYAPARFQLAAALVLKGDFDQAQCRLPVLELRSEMDWSGYRIYLLSLIDQGQYSKARDLAQAAVANCVWRSWRVHFQTLLGFAQLKLKKAADAIKTLEKGLDDLDEHSKLTRLVIIGAAQKARGRAENAWTILERIVRTREPAILAFRSAALRSDRSDWNIPRTTELDLLMSAA
jgi:tetratricopeptide (TPR) repeat protein